MSKNYYNVRNKIGRFSRQTRNNQSQAEFGFVKELKANKKCCGGKCKTASYSRIIPGRLYLFNDSIVVRAFGTVKGRRFVSIHGKLEGFVNDQELSQATKAQVMAYLDNAEN